MRPSTIFELQVYEALKRIPKGKVTTYGAIAQYLGIPKGARAIGGALNKNPHAPHIPCHRVVRSNGSIGGYAFGTKKKVEILKQEGVGVLKNKVDLRKFRYSFV